MQTKISSAFLRAGRWFLELLHPLYGFASTPERRRYWRALPLRRAAKLFAAVFFVLAGIPFFLDIVAYRSFPLLLLLLVAILSGVCHVLVIVSELRRPHWMFLPMLAILALYISLGRSPAIVEDPNSRERRVVFDAICLFAGVMLGYRLFLNFTNTEGLAYVQLETELALAHQIQKTLVPPVSYRGMGLEAFGRTLPSAAVGGDLVDLVVGPQSVFAYLADVSGHGIPAGVLMGMVKSSIRQAVLVDLVLPSMLETVNAVLPSVKEPDMFVTLAALRFEGTGPVETVEFTLAGHPPLLHYHQSAHEVTRHAMIQFPLGLVADPGYLSERVSCGPRDVFALVTDGLIDTLNKRDEEFGLPRLERLLLENAQRPLPQIFDALIAAVSAFGPQQDDRTILLVRILPSESSAAPAT